MYPSSYSRPGNYCRILYSSSTMRMLCMLDNDRRCNLLGSHRQLNHKLSSHRPVFLYPNRAPMVFYDAIHDGQAQTRSSFLGGKVGEKKPLLQLLRDTVAGIGNCDLAGIATGYQPRGKLNLAQQRTLH